MNKSEQGLCQAWSYVPFYAISIPIFMQDKKLIFEAKVKSGQNKLNTNFTKNPVQQCFYPLSIPKNESNIII